MSTKYLGKTFDIHGGGMDLLFPHHECEIAQAVGAYGEQPVKYWMHNNMITLNGKKMGKSLGNAIDLIQFFTGEHELLEQAYSPMTIRFFILQGHYRSTLDFSNEALQAAEKGYRRLMAANKAVKELKYEAAELDEALNKEIVTLCEGCHTYINDDMNTAMVLANLFELTAKVNAFAGKLKPTGVINEGTLEMLQDTFKLFVEDILGLQDEQEADNDVTDGLVQLLISIRQEARANKDFATSDNVRDELARLNIQLKDSKDGTTWSYIN